MEKQVGQVGPFNCENLIGVTAEDAKLQRKYMAMRKKSQSGPYDVYPFMRYMAVLDENTCPKCRTLHGRVWRRDDPIWTAIYPPNGRGCRCRADIVSGSTIVNEGLTVEYSPEFLDYALTSGNPVLTDVGNRLLLQEVVTLTPQPAAGAAVAPVQSVRVSGWQSFFKGCAIVVTVPMLLFIMLFIYVMFNT